MFRAAEVSSRIRRVRHIALRLALLAASCCPLSASAHEPVLENGTLRLQFDSRAGGLTAIVNKLTGETYEIRGDAFVVETTSWCRTQNELPLLSREVTQDRLTETYGDADLSAQVTYELRAADHFFQKYLAITFSQDVGLEQITVSRPEFALEKLQVLCYRHPDFDWVRDYVQAKHGWSLERPEGSEPVRTFLGRTEAGGFFTGLEMPFDSSSLDRTTVTLGYAPSLKVKAGQRLAGETMYLGVYRRSPSDARAMRWTPLSAGSVVGSAANAGQQAAAGELQSRGAQQPDQVLPLPSESRAMTAMTSAILGPPRHGMKALACGWHCQMEQGEYDSDAKLEGDLRSLEFLASCGLDGLTDSHPWGGETEKMAALREGDRYMPGARVQKFLEHARQLKLQVVQWPTMNNTHPWKSYGGPLRLDHPEWLRGVEGDPAAGVDIGNFRRCRANCLACSPFYEWLERTIVEDALGTGYYDCWCMDGDFWGTGAYFNTILPVTCLTEHHDHLPGDSNYACQLRLSQLIAAVRAKYPAIYIAMCRPPMDLGVWAQRNVDACFTLIESGTGGSNIAAGDEVRTASRIRVHHHFFPHWLDWPLLFPSYADPGSTPEWPSDKIDYLLLSALSSSPNLLLYLPSKSGIPAEDQAEIRRWLDWGRANEDYLMVRHDLFDWPGKGVVDGSAHLRGHHGLIFLFNSSAAEQLGEFALTAESTGFSGEVPVEIQQEYPSAERRQVCQPGVNVSWPVPPQSAVVLRITPVH